MVSDADVDCRTATDGTTTRVLYVDDDAETIEALTGYAEREYPDVEVVGIVDPASATEAVGTEEWGCLVVGGDLSADARKALVEAASCPVVSFTRAGRESESDAVLEAAVMVLEKGTDDRVLAMLVDKARQFAASGGDDDAETLARALAHVSETDSSVDCFLVDDGELVWSTRPFEAVFPSVGADRSVGDFDERLAAVFGTVPDDDGEILTTDGDPDDAAGAEQDGRDGTDARYFRTARHTLALEGRNRRLDVFEDVTDRVERETRAGVHELLVEQARDGLYVFDADGVLTFCNDAFASMLGYEPGELVGRHAAEIFAEGELNAAQRDIQNVVSSGASGSAGVRRFLDREGNAVPVSVNYTVLAGDETAFDGFVCVARDVSERRERERELAARRDELARINRADELLQDVVRELGRVSTREELERAVCDRLVAVDGATMAWVGTREGATDRIVPGTVVGDPQQYLREVVASTSREDARDGPVLRAVRSGEVQVANDFREDDLVAPWRDLALSHGLASMAMIPLIHGETVHGVLAVYGDEPYAFGDAMVDRFSLLGDTIGFAITAVQNRRLVERDVAVELEFRSANDDAALVWLAQACDCRLETVGSVDLGDDVLQYLAVDGASVEAVAAAARDGDAVHGARVVRSEGETAGLVELRTPWSLRTTLSEAGARLESAVATPTGVEIVVEAPSDGDVRAIHQAVRRSNPGAELVTKTERDCSELDGTGGLSVETALTDRQREILRAAYLAGYYAWPRDTTAEELADSLGIASPTLHQHLRRAEHNILAALFDD